MVLGCILLGLFRQLGKFEANCLQIQSNFPKIRKFGANVQYFSQMATLLVAFPAYSRYSSQSYIICVAFSGDSEESVQDACVLHTLYGTNVGKLVFSISADLSLFESVGNYPNFLALLIDGVLHLCVCLEFSEIWEILFKMHTFAVIFLIREISEFSLRQVYSFGGL